MQDHIMSSYHIMPLCHIMQCHYVLSCKCIVVMQCVANGHLVCVSECVILWLLTQMLFVLFQEIIGVSTLKLLGIDEIIAASKLLEIWSLFTDIMINKERYKEYGVCVWCMLEPACTKTSGLWYLWFITCARHWRQSHIGSQHARYQLPEMLYPETTMKCSTHEMCYLAWCVRLSTTVCDVRLESESDALLQSAVKISTTLRWLRRGRGTVAVGTAQRPRAEPGAGHDCSHQRGLLLWIQHSVSCCLYICCVAVRVCI